MLDEIKIIQSIRGAFKKHPVFQSDSSRLSIKQKQYIIKKE